MSTLGRYSGLDERHNQPMSSNPVILPGAPDLPVYEPTDQHITELTAIVALLGANGAPITTVQLRPFYRKQPRNKLTALIKHLVDNGVLVEKITNGPNGGQTAIYTLSAK